MSDNEKFIIITSIYLPSEAIARYAAMKGWNLVVVGDRKTPENWQYENVTYLSPADQIELGYSLGSVLPWDHYCRKMIGYLYAMEKGASIIVDTDDDNIPKDDWCFPAFEGTFRQIPKSSGFVNMYAYFTDMKIWPRGYPLQYINDHTSVPQLSEKETINVGVWQGLADGNPDVDAIYRLIDDTPCYFNRQYPIALSEGTICPFNSQNTAIRKELFPLLYLPSYVTFRFTDILRGLIAQPVMWAAGYSLGFSSATVFQERNPHDYLKDFESEIPCYLYAEKVIELVSDVVTPDAPVLENLATAYRILKDHGIVPPEEMKVITAWQDNLKTIEDQL
jgi:hypothetical protein